MNEPDIINDVIAEESKAEFTNVTLIDNGEVY
jgi:hypothetical protein